MATDNNADVHPPVIFVHGVLGWGPEEKGFGRYWRGAHEVEPAPGQRICFASVGPVSSHWDRARELFYRIRGGGVDYGVAHAEKHRHRRRPGDWARLEPYHRRWSAENPVHLVGHSQGACTIRMLQYMLAQGNLFDVPTSADWVRSLTSISGVNNGSTLAYANFPVRPDGRLSRSLTGRISAFLRLIRRTSLHLDHDLALLHRLLVNVPRHDGDYNWDLHHWGLKRRRFLGFPLETYPWLVLRILNHPFLYGYDCAPYDLSVHGMAAWNRKLKEYPRTYYFSYVTENTVAGGDGHHQPGESMSVLLRPFAKAMGRFTGPLQGVDGFEASRWWPNDGGVSAVSQEYPFLGRQAAHVEVEGDWPEQPATQRWHVMKETFRGWDHLDVVVFPDSRERYEQQKEFYRSLVANLGSLAPPP